MILDQNLEKSNNTTAYNYLHSHGVSVVWASPSYAATHEKSIVVDDATVAIMTGNLTSQYYSTSRDFAVIENNSLDVNAVEKTFNAATKSLNIENEEMAYPTVTTALENAAKRGVSVQVTMTNDNNDYATEFDALKVAGVQVHTYAYTASLYIHAKAIVADYDTSNAVVDVGSQNFSNASWNKNRELGFITTSTALITPINAALNSDFTGGTAWP